MNLLFEFFGLKGLKNIFVNNCKSLRAFAVINFIYYLALFLIHLIPQKGFIVSKKKKKRKNELFYLLDLESSVLGF